MKCSSECKCSLQQRTSTASAPAPQPQCSSAALQHCTCCQHQIWHTNVLLLQQRNAYDIATGTVPAEGACDRGYTQLGHGAVASPTATAPDTSRLRWPGWAVKACWCGHVEACRRMGSTQQWPWEQHTGWPAPPSSVEATCHLRNF